MIEQITVERNDNGKIRLYKKPRFVDTNKTPDYKSSFANKRINSELKTMKQEVSHSIHTDSVLISDEHGRINRRVAGYSSMPKYVREIGITGKKDFLSVFNSQKGVRHERLRKEAIDRLNHGYKNEHGYDGPDMEFKQKTGQIYDNKDIIFRRVRGRIVPMRVPKKNRYDLKEEAPF